jgi:hypothetical protein
MTTRAHRLLAIDSIPADSLVASDGSIWSHAATLGVRFKGSSFTIDQATIDNFIRVFTSGYPSKVPVDYEHGTVNGATTTGQPVPKAGNVLELRGVFAGDDFDGELRATAEKLSQKAGRPIDDPKNLGLWMRWKPTDRALGMIKAGEYSELSIAFDEDMKNNTTGDGQGPGLYSVALTNLPFLDDMLPVAASRGRREGESQHDQQDRTPAERDGATTPREEHAMSTKMLAATTALTGKPVVTEDEAVAEITAYGVEIKAVREYGAVVGAELGEADPAKAVASIRQLKADNAQFKATADSERKTRIAATVESFLLTKEARIASVPLRAMLSRQLTAELEAAPDKAAAETETAKTIDSMPESNVGRQATGGDAGNPTNDIAIAGKAKDLRENDPEVKALAARDPNGAMLLAATKAAQFIQAKQ